MFLCQFFNSDFYKMLNSQLFAACIGAFVTIFGVWLTIYNDRKARRIERKNEIRPIYSISFIGIEDTVKLKKEYHALSIKIHLVICLFYNLHNLF